MSDLIYISNMNYTKLSLLANGETLNIWAYIFVLFIILMMLILRILTKGRWITENNLKQIRMAALSALCAVMMIQVLDQIKYLEILKDLYANKSIHAKYESIFGETYKFTEFAKMHCPLNCRGQLLTDLDINKTIEPYVLKYFLFPQINIIDQNNIPECLVVFDKFKPEQNIPQGYKIAGVFDEISLVAVKK